jgi:DNA-binding transcriptional LysR family regulator
MHNRHTGVDRWIVARDVSGTENTVSESRIGNLQVEWLEAFVLVADYGKRTAAAERMGRDQGNLTKLVQKLERWFRQPLVETGSSPARLTPAGKEFVELAREVVQKLRNARPDLINENTVSAPLISGADVTID